MIDFSQNTAYLYQKRKHISTEMYFQNQSLLLCIILPKNDTGISFDKLVRGLGQLLEKQADSEHPENAAAQGKKLYGRSLFYRSSIARARS